MLPERTPGASAVADEWLDVVDMNDAVTGTARRGDIHAQGLLHRAVHMLVFNRRDELYLQRRSMQKDTAPGLWDTSAAGHVDSGECYTDAAQRELAEELSLVNEQLVPLWKLAPSEKTGQEFVMVYACRTQAQPQPDRVEIAAGGWRTLADVRDWMSREPAVFTGTLKLIMSRLRDSMLITIR